MLQDGRPIGFGSRSLIASEKNCAQIELELLTLLYGLEHFHQIIYETPVEVHTDHKPLENIVKKPLPIIQGWPEENVNILSEVKPYETVKHLTIQNGLIFVGDRIVIPSHLRKEFIKDRHLAHSGIESCLRTIREYVFWPQMSAQIKEHCQRCEI